jgi:hypothetical protein
VNVPDWYQSLLLALAAWRTFQLISDDDILDRPRRWLLQLGDAWEKEGDPIPSGYRYGLGAFISCPYCIGFWIAVSWWAIWELFPNAVTIAAVPFALSAGVVASAKLLNRDTSE